MEAELRIVAELSRRPQEAITTHQLAKLVGKSYSFTYTAVQRMAKAGMIRQQVVGRAVLCALVLKHHQVQALLALHAAMQNGHAWREELHELFGSLLWHIAVLRVESKPVVVCPEELAILVKKKLPHATILTEETAKDWVSKLDFARLEIASNAAYFWAVVGDTHA